jgi:hypothetical protein
MKKIFSILTIVVFSLQAYTQTLVIDPAFPVATKPVVIYFHSDQVTGNTSLKNYTDPLYLHTGLICSDDTKWQYVIGSWGNNTTQPSMEYLGSFTYKFTVTPDLYTYYSALLSKTINKIAIVIRSADGKKQTDDLFVDVSEEKLNVTFSLPESRNIISELNDSIPVKVNASMADSIALYTNGSFVTGISALSLDYTFYNTEYGENEIVAIAFSGSESVSDTFHFYVRPDPLEEDLPEGVIDGINYESDTSAILCLYAPDKEYAFVLGDFSGWNPKASTYMKKTPDGKRFWLRIGGLIPGTEYAYQYLVDGTQIIGDPYTNKVLDPWNDQWINAATYPDLKPYPVGKTTGIVSVLETARPPYTWKNTDFTPVPKAKAVIYEILLRDFVAKHDWKTLTDTLDYFTKLGVTALEIMPFSEFEGNESWGYNPSYYFAADKYYGPDSDLKVFVDSCHSRGIAVIMDMVLNHSYGQSPLVQLYWDAANGRPSADNPWYNQTSPNTVYSWGYDFNHESQATKDFVDRVTSYWLTEFKIDGFRFDFTKGFTNTPGDGSAYDASRIAILKRMTDKIWTVNPDAYVILEHFTSNTEEKELADYGLMIWGNINYNYNEATMGWNESGKSDFSNVSYKKRNWSEPGLVGYMESHDEERLMFKNLTYGNLSGTYNIKDLNTALSRIELAAAFFITIPGPKMIWQFGELGYDISIESGGRVSKKPIKWDYLNNESRLRLNQVYSSLIYLKETEPAFSTSDYSVFLGTSVKRIEMNHSDMNIRIIGNFDIINKTIDPKFSSTGNWYEYFSGDTLDVTDPNALIELKPGEYRIYTTKALETPVLEPSVVAVPLSKIESFSVFPNPAGDHITVEGKSQIYEIIVCNAAGKTVRVLNPGTHRSTVDIRDLNAGIYLVTVRMKDSVSVQKLVKN